MIKLRNDHNRIPVQQLSLWQCPFKAAPFLPGVVLLPVFLRLWAGESRAKNQTENL